jgi:hypothetical protein
MVNQNPDLGHNIERIPEAPLSTGETSHTHTQCHSERSEESAVQNTCLHRMIPLVLYYLDRHEFR